MLALRIRSFTAGYNLALLDRASGHTRMLRMTGSSSYFAVSILDGRDFWAGYAYGKLYASKGSAQFAWNTFVCIKDTDVEALAQRANG